MAVRLLPLLLALLALGAAVARSAAAAEPPAAYQGGPSHDGAVEADIVPRLGKRWARSDLGSPNTPVLYEGRVFVTAIAPDGEGSSTSTLHALDAGSGASLWSSPDTVGEVSVADGLVFARTRSGVVARDAASGALQWASAVGLGLSGSPDPVVAGELVLLGGGTGITALRAADGAPVWTTRASSAPTGLVAADGERAYALGCGGSVFAAERTRGSTAWEVPGECSGGAAPPAPVVGAGRVWGERSIHAADDGRTLAPWSGPRPAIAGDRLIVADGTFLRQTDLEGRLIWEEEGPDTILRSDIPDVFTSPPLVVGAQVYARVGKDRVVGYDALTGRERWRSKTRVLAPAAPGQPVPGLAARGDRLVVPFPDKLIGYGQGRSTRGVDPDPWRNPEVVTVALGAPAKPSLDFGRTTTLPATYVRTLGLDDEGLNLVLQADPFPYGRWVGYRLVAPAELKTGVRVRPDRNTRYRLRYGGVSPAKVTEAHTVTVDLRVRVRVERLERGLIRARATVRGPGDRLRRLEVPFYAARPGAARARRLGVGRLERTGATRASSSVVLRLPKRLGPRPTIFSCLPETRDDGFGAPDAARRDCGGASVAATPARRRSSPTPPPTGAP